MPHRLKLSDVKHSVFMSHSHADDEAWNRFISSFNAELNRGLRCRLHDLQLPKTFFSSKDPAVQGRLSVVLQEAIDASIAMMIFVHDGYVRSGVCLQELRQFRELFNADGFENWLYVIAMSEKAIGHLTSRPEWRKLLPYDDQIWVRFFRAEERNLPLSIYQRTVFGEEALVASEFWELFVKIREDLVEKIIATFGDEAQTALHGTNAARSRRAQSPDDKLELLVYIEGEPGQEPFWDPLGNQVASSWQRVIKSQPRVPQLLLRPTGLPMHDLHSRPYLDGADGVVLMWGAKAPESLLAQIEMVEPRLTGPDFAPGLIAYIMQPGEDLEKPIPREIRSWPVVRFVIKPSTDPVKPAIEVLDGDRTRLEVFLNDMLAHKRCCA